MSRPQRWPPTWDDVAAPFGREPSRDAEGGSGKAGRAWLPVGFERAARPKAELDILGSRHVELAAVARTMAFRTPAETVGVLRAGIRELGEGHEHVQPARHHHPRAPRGRCEGIGLYLLHKGGLTGSAVTGSPRGS